MIAGSEGLGGIEFTNAAWAQALGVVALVYILFAGGLDTDLKAVRPVLVSGGVLGTVGVIITCLLTGAFAHWLLDFNWWESFLLGAIVSSTDAGAVFTVLREKSIRFKGRVQPLLEFESGINDPMTVLLTVGFIALLTGKIATPWELLPRFLIELVSGTLIGIGSGYAMAWLLNRIKLEAEGLYPVLSFACVLFIYSMTQSLGASGFLAVYLCGLVLRHQVFIHKKSLILFHEGFAWIMQIAMFLALGLLVFPSQLVVVTQEGVALSAFLVFVARPVAVFLSLAGAQFNFREKLLISWVGLRGSVPIIFATYPLLAGIGKAELIFNLVFFIVLTSVLVQGTGVARVARWLRVDAPIQKKVRFPLEYIPTGNMMSDLVAVQVPKHSPIVGKSILELGLPKDALVVLIQRKGNVIVPKGGTHLEVDDAMLVLAEKSALAEVHRLVGPQA